MNAKNLTKLFNSLFRNAVYNNIAVCIECLVKEKIICAVFKADDLKNRTRLVAGVMLPQLSAEIIFRFSEKSLRETDFSKV
jgi:hypothetical protein